MDRQPDKARHLECCAGGGEALSRAKEEPLEGAQKILNYLLETAHLTLKFKQDSTVDVGTLAYVGPTLQARPLTVDQFREHWFLRLPCL